MTTTTTAPTPRLAFYVEEYVTDAYGSAWVVIAHGLHHAAALRLVQAKRTRRRADKMETPEWLEHPGAFGMTTA
jgi:hypothetical protein